MPDTLQPLIAYLRSVPITAHYWLNECDNDAHDILTSTAYVNAGLPLVRIDDPRKYTRWVREVYDALHDLEREEIADYEPVQSASVLLGVGTCAYCDREEVDDRCPDPCCEANYRRPTSLNRFGGRNV